MTNLNFENKLYLTGTCAIWHRWLWCAPTCALSNETPFDPVRCGISELWSENHIPYCWAELPYRNQMSDCQKWQLKNENRPKELFWDDFWFLVNLIRRIWICKNFDFSTMFTRDTGLQSSKITKKVKKWIKSHSLIFVCLWVIRLWRTRISTRFWWFYDPLPRYGSLKMQNRPKLTVNGAKI